MGKYLTPKVTAFVAGCLLGGGVMWLACFGRLRPTAASGHASDTQDSLQRELLAQLKEANEHRAWLEASASHYTMVGSFPSDVETVRSQLELYRVEHSQYPNGLTSDVIRVGQKLKIPFAAKAAVEKPTTPAQAPEPAAPVPAEATVHVVAPGETLYGLARKYYGDAKQMSRIREANPDADLDNLPVGCRLIIPRAD